MEDHLIMPDQQRGTDRAGRRAKRFLSPSQKYEVFLQLVRQELTMAEAAEQWQVDRGTIMRIRTVAKEGALEALASSRPGPRAKERDFELEAARADAARLGEALKEMAVKLMVVEGKGSWGWWPRPEPSRRGHQGGPAPTAGRGGRRRLELAGSVPRARAR